MTSATHGLPPEQIIGFLRCLNEAMRTEGMIANFNRLWGRHLLERGPKSGMDAAIDKATGYDKHREKKDAEDMRAFALFVRQCVWNTLPPEVRLELSGLKVEAKT